MVKKVLEALGIVLVFLVVGVFFYWYLRGDVDEHLNSDAESYMVVGIETSKY